VKALMVGRVADIVLDRRLTDDSEVRLVRDAEDLTATGFP
jgi:hypothetical protein